ncbi:MAG TPA: DUF3429 domain-containing protein [Vineibacter sp.]|nr:DUF3429 domain-containing protein [Vineibacter sp.]
MPRAVESRRDAAATDRRVPSVALMLGAISTLPMVAGAAAIVLSDSAALRLYSHVAMVSYGACMLSFLGAVHAGLAFRDTPLAATRLLVAAAAPALAWMSLAVGEDNGLLLMAVSFLALLAYDIAAARRGWAPAWYPRLRWPLTGVTLICLLVTMRFAPL